MIKQPTFTNYSTHYQTEQILLNQQPINQQQQQIYSASPPAYNASNQLQDSQLLAASPVYQLTTNTQQIQNLDQQSPSTNYLPQQTVENYNKVIEMPILQSSMSINEGMYQQLQQQKTFATSTNFNLAASNQQQQKYPWPMPKNS